jgi:D-serine deaminase-like pyridoxal phosphate-dependent protein
MAARSMIGAPKAAVDTPALLAAGAIGVTCAKLGEAEVLAATGIRDILIANQIVGPAKTRRLVDLLATADPIVAVDSAAHVDELGAALHGTGHTLRVVIEVDNRRTAGRCRHRVGAHDRCAAWFALRRRDGLGEPRGHHCRARREGACRGRCYCPAYIERRSLSGCRLAGGHRQLRRHRHLPYCAQQTRVTEIQAGGAIFSDMRYRTNYHLDIPAAPTLLATVTSRPTPTRVIIDAGKKAMSSAAAVPMALGVAANRVELSAEHGTIELAEPSDLPRIGDKLELIAGYSDTTVHLHEEIVAVRDGRIEAIWYIAGRGRIK